MRFTNDDVANLMEAAPLVEPGVLAEFVGCLRSITNADRRHPIPVAVLMAFQAACAKFLSFVHVEEAARKTVSELAARNIDLPCFVGTGNARSETTLLLHAVAEGRPVDVQELLSLCKPEFWVVRIADPLILALAHSASGEDAFECARILVDYVSPHWAMYKELAPRRKTFSSFLWEQAMVIAVRQKCYKLVEVMAAACSVDVDWVTPEMWVLPVRETVLQRLQIETRALPRSVVATLVTCWCIRLEKYSWVIADAEDPNGPAIKGIERVAKLLPWGFGEVCDQLWDIFDSRVSGSRQCRTFQVFMLQEFATPFEHDEDRRRAADALALAVACGNTLTMEALMDCGVSGSSLTTSFLRDVSLPVMSFVDYLQINERCSVLCLVFARLWPDYPRRSRTYYGEKAPTIEKLLVGCFREIDNGVQAGILVDGAESRQTVTPLHFAAASGHYRLAALLVAYGADTTLTVMPSALSGLTSKPLCALELAQESTFKTEKEDQYFASFVGSVSLQCRFVPLAAACASIDVTFDRLCELLRMPHNPFMGPFSGMPPAETVADCMNFVTNHNRCFPKDMNEFQFRRDNAKKRELVLSVLKGWRPLTHHYFPASREQVHVVHLVACRMTNLYHGKQHILQKKKGPANAEMLPLLPWELWHLVLMFAAVEGVLI